MPQYDRLSALMQHFQMRVSLADPGDGNLIVIGDPDTGPEGIAFWPRGTAADGERRLFEASADWGGAANPLLAALPERLAVDGADDETIALLMQMLMSEAADGRCGSASALNRLCEVLIIRLLRREIERGATTPGLLSGLADRQLSRALVVMHDRPGQDWRNSELAEVAGMSLSRFSDRFVEKVGETPQSYLRRWRMTLARQDIAAGQRIQSVARRLGYGSPEALSRAFNRHFGVSPMDVRKAALEPA